MDLTYGNDLTYLDAQLTGLTKIEVPKNNSLETLYVDGSTLKYMNYSDLYNIKTLRIGDCNINSFKVNNMSKLQTVYFSSLRGTEYIDFRYNKDLTTIGIDNNDLANINVTGLSGLQTLGIVNSPLTLITGLSTLSNLNQLYLDGCAAISTVDFTGINNVSEVSMIGCTGLVSLSRLGQLQDGVIVAIILESCSFSASALNNIFTQLPLVTNSAYISYVGCPGESTCNTSIYTGKGWTSN